MARDAVAWDKQFEEDVAAGRLDALADEAIRDLRNAQRDEQIVIRGISGAHASRELSLARENLRCSIRHSQPTPSNMPTSIIKNLRVVAGE